MKKYFQVFVLGLVALLIISSFSFVVKAKNDYVFGYTVTSCVIRERPSSNSNNLGRLKAFTYVDGYKEGNWIQVEDGYIYDFGLVDGEYINGRSPSKINVRNKPNGEIVGSINALGKVEGIKKSGSNWIAIGPNRWVYDLNISNPPNVSGFTLASVNVRGLDSGKIVDKYNKFTYVEDWRKVGNYIVNFNNNVYFYDFGLVDGEYINGRAPSKINVRNKPNGEIVGSINALGKVEGIKKSGSNWIAIGPNRWVYDLNISNPTTGTTEEPQNYEVFVTNTGGQYHREGCRYLKNSKIPISKDSALARGYKPCKVCKP